MLQFHFRYAMFSPVVLGPVMGIRSHCCLPPRYRHDDHCIRWSPQSSGVRLVNSDCDPLLRTSQPPEPRFRLWSCWYTEVVQLRFRDMEKPSDDADLVAAIASHDICSTSSCCRPAVPSRQLNLVSSSFPVCLLHLPKLACVTPPSLIR